MTRPSASTIVPVGCRIRVGAMGGHHGGQRRRRRGSPPAPLSTSRFEVALVHEQDAGLPVEGAGKQQPLPLSAGKRRAHVADQGVVVHRHGHDLVVDPGHHGAGPQIESGWAEEADVVGEAAGKSWSSCITTPDLRPERLGPEMLQRHPVDQDLAGRRLERPSITFSRVVLPPPEGPVIATNSPGSIMRSTPSRTSGSVSA